jgi:hypothetical protein
MAVFFGASINVDVTRPWVDIVGDLTVLFVVVAAVVGQMLTTGHAARAHNHRRQALAEGRHHNAERESRRRLTWLTWAMLCSAGVVGLLVYRVWSVAASGSGPAGLIMVIAFSSCAGLTAPILRFASIAFDGSSHSRRRDDLNQQLVVHDEAREITLKSVSAQLVRIEMTKDTYQSTARRHIVDTARNALVAGHRKVQLLRLMLGLLSAAPATTSADAWSLSSGLSTVPDPEHAPLLVRDLRLSLLMRQAHALQLRLRERTTPHLAATPEPSTDVEVPAGQESPPSDPEVPRRNQEL